MPKKKKGGKKKKGDKKGAGKTPIITTRDMLLERERCMCPRLGDKYGVAERAEEVKREVAYFSIRRAAFNDLPKLSLSGLSLPVVPEEIAQRPELTKLQSLDLSRNELFNLYNVFGILKSLDGLRQLDLSRNYLHGQMPEDVAELRNLECLKIDHNQITAIPEAMGALVKLHTFSASHNQLLNLPESTSGWTALTRLNLRKNKLVMLPTGFANWQKMRKLWLGYNQLTELPESVGGMLDLEDLDVTANQIVSIPDSLCACTKLNSLHLGQNKITEISPSILTAVTSLKELHLFKNKIEVLPPEVGELRNVKKMSLASNNLRGLPTEIKNCRELEELYVSNNPKFAKLPESFGHLRMLKELSARHCKALKSIPVSVAQGCVNLQELDVRVPKKPVCKIAPDVVSALEARMCKIRGHVAKKGKKGKKGKGKKK